MPKDHGPKRTHADLLHSVAQAWAEHQGALVIEAADQEERAAKEAERAALASSLAYRPSVIEPQQERNT